MDSSPTRRRAIHAGSHQRAVTACERMHAVNALSTQGSLTVIRLGFKQIENKPWISVATYVCESCHTAVQTDG